MQNEHTEKADQTCDLDDKKCRTCQPCIVSKIMIVALIGYALFTIFTGQS